MSTVLPGVEAATKKVLDGIEDEEVADRYPNRTHFVPADHAEHAEMLGSALLEGDPAVLVFPDGREILFVPERPTAVKGILLRFATLRRRLEPRGRRTNTFRLPPLARIEARDSAGEPLVT